jgi:serine phosphatase RsbU (regulator of sigma subunit)
VERLEATATVIGLFAEWDCAVAEARLAPGDILSLYTDGITETTGDGGKEFGEEGLAEALRANQDLEASHIVHSVQSAVQRFRLGEQEDDLTLVVARAL